jgi:hypothetical protein
VAAPAEAIMAEQWPNTSQTDLDPLATPDMALAADVPLREGAEGLTCCSVEDKSSLRRLVHRYNSLKSSLAAQDTGDNAQGKAGGRGADAARSSADLPSLDCPAAGRFQTAERAFGAFSDAGPRPAGGGGQISGNLWPAAGSRGIQHGCQPSGAAVLHCEAGDARSPKL